MTDLLCLESRLTCTNCAKLIVFLANCDLPWKSRLIHFLVVKSDLPGSGVAAVLSCDLSGFSWDTLFMKGHEGLNMESVKAIVSLKGAFVSKNLFALVRHVDDCNVTLLQFALNHSKPTLDDLIKLHEVAEQCNKHTFAAKVAEYSLSARDFNRLIQLALKVECFNFVEALFMQKADLDPVFIVNSLKKDDLNTQSGLVSHIMSLPEGRTQLFFKAIQCFEFKLAQDCLKPPLGEVIKAKIDLNSVFSKFSMKQATKDKRQQFISLIKDLLDLGIDSNGQDGHVIPLDMILRLPNDYHTEKLELLVLLLQHGADIARSTYETTMETTLIHFATKLAIDSGTHYYLT